MEKINKQKLAIYLFILSLPMLWYGFSNFEVGGKSSAEAFLLAITFTSGIVCFCSSIYLIFGMTWMSSNNQGREVTLASQNVVGDPPILEPILNPIKKEKKMSEEIRVQNPPGGRSSVQLIQREKELKAEEQELQHQLELIRLEKTGLEKELQAKGWIRNYEREWDVPAL